LVNRRPWMGESPARSVGRTSLDPGTAGLQVLVGSLRRMALVAALRKMASENA
jgi:hypothetical protein